MTKRIAIVVAIAFCFLGVVCSTASVSAKDKWMRVRSKNFLIVGNAGEKELRQVGVKLEQFREVFSRLFTTLKVNSPVPTTVIVFKNDESYRPFKPNASTSGYFQSGPDVNYITLELSSDLNSQEDPFAVILHEYTHLLVSNTSRNVSTWLNEGLAEYYSNFAITRDQKVVVGRPIASHVYRLRENKLLPLRTLFQVDPKSPYYNERDKQSIFYAESWALVHYLMLGKDGQHMPQLTRFVELSSAGTPMEKAFQDAFAMTFEVMEKELRDYIQRDRYPILSGSFRSKVGYDSAMQAEPITEAEAQAYLGDLLLKSGRAEAEIFLQRALELDPDLPMANASLGLFRMGQGKHEEARKWLERAVAASSQNYLVHYYYAYALSREGNRDMETVMGMAPETAAITRRELKRAIELRPDFVESYSLLAFVNLVTENEIEETTEMLKRALAGSPNRPDLMFMLAQLYLRQRDFKTARQYIDNAIANGAPELRQRAQQLLTRLVSVEEHLAGEATAQTIEHPFDAAAALRDALRRPATGETQTQGSLTRIDCDAKGIIFLVKVSDRMLKLNTDTFRNTNIMSFSDDAGRELTCGVRKTQNNVVVAYVPKTDPRAKTDGVLKSVEFVPPDFKLKP